MKKIVIPVSNAALMQALIDHLDNQFTIPPEENVLVRSFFYKHFPEASGETHPVVTNLANTIPAERDCVLIMYENGKLTISTKIQSELKDAENSAEYAFIDDNGSNLIEEMQVLTQIMEE